MCIEERYDCGGEPWDYDTAMGILCVFGSSMTKTANQYSERRVKIKSDRNWTRETKTRRRRRRGGRRTDLSGNRGSEIKVAISVYSLIDDSNNGLAAILNGLQKH